MLDAEQITCFIFDSLCNDSSIRKIIEAKRKFEIVDQEAALEGQNAASSTKHIGGLKVKERYEKLPEGRRQEMKRQYPIL